MATKDYFLKIEGIEGESEVEKHKGEIDVESFSWGENNDRVHGQGSAAKRKVTMQALTISMFASKATPLLMRACATSQKLPKVVLTLRKAGGKQEEYMSFTLLDVYITSYNIVGPANERSKEEKVGHEKRENSIPLEQITLDFAAITVESREQKAGGNVGPANKFIYNLPRMAEGQ